MSCELSGLFWTVGAVALYKTSLRCTAGLPTQMQLAKVVPCSPITSASNTSLPTPTSPHPLPATTATTFPVICHRHPPLPPLPVQLHQLSASRFRTGFNAFFACVMTEFIGFVVHLLSLSYSAPQLAVDTVSLTAVQSSNLLDLEK